MQMSDSPANKRPRDTTPQVLVVVKLLDPDNDDETIHLFWSTEEDPKKLKVQFYQHLSPLGLISSGATDRGEFVPIQSLFNGSVIHSGKTVVLAIDDDRDTTDDEIRFTLSTSESPWFDQF
jgi:hypothetical protein